MAKKDRRLEDLDDELARLEAELAALERGEEVPAAPAKKPETSSLADRLRKKKAKAAPEDAASSSHADDGTAGETEAADDGESKSRFKPKLPAVSGLLKKRGRSDAAEGEALEAAPAEPAGETDADGGSSGARELLGRFKRPGKSAGSEEEEAPPEEAPEAPAPDEADAPGEEKGPGKLLGRLTRKKDEEAEPAPAVAEDPTLPPDNAEWVREGNVWRRVEAVDGRIVVRRRVSESGEVVFEAPATEKEWVAAGGAAEGERALVKGLFARFRKPREEDEEGEA